HTRALARDLRPARAPARRADSCRAGFCQEGRAVIKTQLPLPRLGKIVSIQKKSLAGLEKLVNVRFPGSGDLGGRHSPLALLAQGRRAREAVDRHLVELVFVRRLLPPELLG